MSKKEQLLERLQVCIKNSRLARERVTAESLKDNDLSRTIKRLWGVNETAELVGVSRQAIKLRETNGTLPPPRKLANGRVEGYTIYEIDNMRKAFDRRPLAFNPENDEFCYRSYLEPLNTVTVSVQGPKGGSYKTTFTVHFAQWLAMIGYKVLVVDTDPQATFTRYMGLTPDKDVFAQDTVLPWMLGQKDDLIYALRETHWPGLDIIPSCLAMQRIESDMSDYYEELPYEPHLMLRAGLETVADDYDIILIDGSPNLGKSSLNQFFAGDIILCPTPAELYDSASTEQLFDAIYGMVSRIEEDIDYIPDIRVLVTKYSSAIGSSSHLMFDILKECWGPLVLENCIKVTEEVGKGQYRCRSIFEQASHLKQRSNASSWNNANKIFTPLFKEVLYKLIQHRWYADYTEQLKLEAN